MGRTSRRVLVGIAAVAALVAVIIAVPIAGRHGDGTAGPTAQRAIGALAQQLPGPASSSRAVTVPALPSRSGSASGSPTTPPGPTRPATSRSASATTSTTGPHTPARRPTTAASRPTSRPTQPAAATTTTRSHRPPTTTRPTPASTTRPAPPPATTAKPTSTTPKPPKPPAPGPAKPNFGIPVTVGNARQVVTVTASSSSATTGTLRAWQQRANGSWFVALGPYPAWLGSQGIGHQSEYVSRTPLGTFTLTEAFGRDANPGTELPYHRTTPDDWWVSDVNSPLYNTLQTCSKCSFNTSVSEHLYYEVPYYDYAVVMDVNRSPVVKGAGSAFFLHVSPDHRPTAGCVAIDVDHLLAVMRWLQPSAHPRIATGID